MSDDAVKPRSKIKLAAAIAAGIALIVLGSLALQIEDWSRDLTVNVAVTDPNASKPALRPITTARSQGEVATIVREAAATLPGWELTAEEVAPGRYALVFVRTTRLFRFKDDITVEILEEGGAQKVSARSSSRVGKGDLGQNPRNLALLLTKVREKLGD